jgi:hypothetical protein
MLDGSHPQIGDARLPSILGGDPSLAKALTVFRESHHPLRATALARASEVLEYRPVSA